MDAIPMGTVAPIRNFFAIFAIFSIFSPKEFSNHPNFVSHTFASSSRSRTSLSFMNSISTENMAASSGSSSA